MENYQYIREIVQAVDQSGKYQSIIREEMIDHFCSFYESLILEMDDYIAMQKTLTAIHETSFQTQKKHSMYPTKIALLTLCFLPLSLFLIKNEETPASYKKVVLSELPFEVNDDPPYGLPVASGKLTSSFGNRMHPIKKVLKFHKGIDFKASMGTPVITVESGVVIDAGFHEKNGNYIVIKHDEVYTTRYHHLSKIDVEIHQKVSAKDKIGEVGSSGHSTGPHLHYEVIQSGENVDPELFIKA